MIQSAKATCLVSFVLLCASTAANTGFAHPFHISIAELEFNSKTGRIEVSLKMHASDLERALQTQLRRRVNVEKEKLDAEISKYLSEHFRIIKVLEKDASEDAEIKSLSSIKMAGTEMETSWIWLFFEMEVDKEARQSKMQLENTVLLDLIDKQINMVSVRYSKKRKSLKMTAKSPRADFSGEWLGKNAPVKSAD